MFTGLIQALGKIQPLGEDRFSLTVPENPSSIVQDLAIGDSVAVNGVCLTVEELLRDGFVATASPETLQRSNLGQSSQVASWVNIETSLRVGSKLGGHFVTGHVDSVGCFVEAIQTEKAWEITFAAIPSLTHLWEKHIARYLVPKGSIAVNGISLTVANCDTEGKWFQAAVIPHTYSHTNLKYLSNGSWVNIESDILGKYVDKLLGHALPSQNDKDEISLDFLTEHGYV